MRHGASLEKRVTSILLLPSTVGLTRSSHAGKLKNACLAWLVVPRANLYCWLGSIKGGVSDLPTFKCSVSGFSGVAWDWTQIIATVDSNYKFEWSITLDYYFLYSINQYTVRCDHIAEKQAEIHAISTLKIGLEWTIRHIFRVLWHGVKRVKRGCCELRLIW